MSDGKIVHRPDDWNFDEHYEDPCYEDLVAEADKKRWVAGICITKAVERKKIMAKNK